VSENFLCTDSEIEASVIGYLGQHPHAADSLDGVVKWWLARQRYETAHERIGRTMEQMAVGGILDRRTLPDGTVLYSLHPVKGDTLDRSVAGFMGRRAC
jgi:hypothetical protein